VAKTARCGIDGSIIALTIHFKPRGCQFSKERGT
jgi:hypothetical protein